VLFTIGVTILVLGVLIFVHELGHFMAAKAVGIEVPRFSIGLGPKMFGFRRGETEYVLSWLPLGGYVKMAGMADEEVTSKLEGGLEKRAPSSRDFEAKPVWARTLVILAGVIMNWLFAIGAFTALAVETGVLEPLVGEVTEGSPAEAAGLQPGDLIRAIDGTAVGEPTHVTLLIQRKPGEPVDILVERDGEMVRLRATPEPVEQYSEIARESLTVGRIGITVGADSTRAVGPVEALGQGWGQTVYWTGTVIRFLKDLVTGRSSVRELGGPIMIGQISGEAARGGIWPLLAFMAVISINLAVLNLLPIPVLDGGHLVFLLIEGVRGRALSLDQRLRWTTAGMVVVVGLMIWAIGNDLMRLFRL
jgi:regulator of sigma E protease